MLYSSLESSMRHFLMLGQGDKGVGWGLVVVCAPPVRAACGQTASALRSAST